jgi:hypothetical protein
MSGLVEATTAQVIAWTHVELFHARASFRPHHYGSVRRALRQMGYVGIRRGGGRGRPIVWTLPHALPRKARQTIMREPSVG